MRRLWFYLAVLSAIAAAAPAQTPGTQTVPISGGSVTVKTTVGPAGLKGDPGLAGPTGPQGARGEDGRDGLPGGNSPGANWPDLILSAMENPGDARAAIQSAVDAAGPAGLTLVGQFEVGGPVYLDREGSALGGFNRAASITGSDYGGPVLAVGVRRLERSGLNSADFRRVTGSLDASAANYWAVPRASLATRGKAALLVPSHPASLGGPFPTSGKPDYFQGDAYTWDLLVEKGDSGPPSGMLASSWGADEPEPFGFVCDPAGGAFRFYWKTAGQAFRKYHSLELPVVGDGPWRLTAQWDGKAGRTDFWVNGTTTSDLGPPASKLAKPRGVNAFTIGAAHGYIDGAVTDMVCSGFRLTRGLVYARAAQLAMLDGSAVNDSRFFTSLQTPARQTFAVLPLGDGPATHVRVDSGGWSGVGFWVASKPIWSSDLTVKSLKLSTALQPAVVVGPTFGVTVDDCDLAGGTQGLASLPTECTYPLRMRRVKVSGDDCAMFLHQVICYADHVTFARAGREALRFDGGSFLGDKLFVTFTNDATEYFLRFYAQGYGNSHRIRDLLIDNEAYNPNLLGAIEMEASLYCVNRLLLDGVDLGGLPAGATFLHLIGHGLGPASGGYTRANVDARNLSVFGATAVGLKADGVGWCGDFDGRGLTPFKAVGDVGFISVLQPIPPMPGEPAPAP